jgi:hypothetical protein
MPNGVSIARVQRDSNHDGNALVTGAHCALAVAIKGISKHAARYQQERQVRTGPFGPSGVVNAAKCVNRWRKTQRNSPPLSQF